MISVAFIVKMVARQGLEDEVSSFLSSAVELANAEAGTPVWLALRTDTTTFWIVDAFPGQPERQAHLDGPIAVALMANADRLLAEPPQIQAADILASKITP